ncbi:MAG: L,D-transpeptidase family protein [Betaproteobacteria bacterium]|nr:L,D-transpeptidase family protein [Betaproteobacteria bacterium]
MDGPEPQLIKIFAAIENNRIDTALEETDALLERYPNFRLGYLIRGDLLLARARPLTTLGNISDAPPEKLADLREEAIARLRAYRQKPPADVVPRYLMQMPSNQKYAVVVDIEKARLYLYANEGGTPRFAADYYISHGKLGANKAREGDKKTPVGVYYVTSRLPREKLTDFYGSGAFPINYPNEWDKRLGRNGFGIWLHGTPTNTFSRPPKASDGCVVLANQDFDALTRNIQPGLTPVIISSTVEWTPLKEWNRERETFDNKLEEWRLDWESRDTDRLLRHYAKNFRAGDQDLSVFAKQKKQVNAGKKWIKVELSDLSLFRYPVDSASLGHSGGKEMVVATFLQNYQSNNLSNQMKKRQYWIREDNDWKIIYEGAV